MTRKKYECQLKPYQVLVIL